MLQSIKQFLAGMVSTTLCPLPRRRYPFTFPDRALTQDWEMVGKDIQHVLDEGIPHEAEKSSEPKPTTEICSEPASP